MGHLLKEKHQAGRQFLITKEKKIIITNHWDSKIDTQTDVTSVYAHFCKKLGIKTFADLSFEETKTALRLFLQAYQNQ